MGDDNIPGFMVRDCSRILSQPLCILFNLSLATGIFPDAWKTVRLTPIHKKGDASLLENYRPIAIINNFAKVFEICLYNTVFPMFRPFLSQCQHGFVDRRSTVTNLAVVTQFLSEALDGGEQADVVYTDFSKAFDRLNHSRLLLKLDAIGFSPLLQLLFRSYLSNRRQYVGFRGHRSNYFTPLSGVPQGSNLGPLLFLIFINDLPSVLDCGRLLFADDLKIFAGVASIDDCEHLQNQLNLLCLWCLDNDLSLNISKCNVVSYSRKSTIINFSYQINNTTLKRCSTIMDLGVIFDSSLTFNDHIKNIIASSLRSLGFVIRNTKYFSLLHSVVNLYFSFVRSKLEYASLVWSPFYKTYSHSVEQVQRRFLKYLHLKQYGTYPERGFNHSVLLNMFGFQSLEQRRIQTDIKFLFNLVNNRTDVISLSNSLSFAVPQYSARQVNTFYSALARTNVMLHAPLYRICNYFNHNLSSVVDIHSTSLSSIMNSVSNVLT